MPHGRPVPHRWVNVLGSGPTYSSVRRLVVRRGWLKKANPRTPGRQRELAIANRLISVDNFIGQILKEQIRALKAKESLSRQTPLL